MCSDRRAGCRSRSSGEPPSPAPTPTPLRRDGATRSSASRSPLAATATPARRRHLVGGGGGRAADAPTRCRPARECEWEIRSQTGSATTTETRRQRSTADTLTTTQWVNTEWQNTTPWHNWSKSLIHKTVSLDVHILNGNDSHRQGQYPS